jgi:hypothetical protein
VLVGQVLLNSGHLLAVREVGGDTPGLAVLRQGCDGFIDPSLFPTDDDDAATAGDDVGGRVASHAAAAADCHQFVPLKVSGHLKRSFLLVDPCAHPATVCAIERPARGPDGAPAAANAGPVAS